MDDRQIQQNYARSFSSEKNFYQTLFLPAGMVQRFPNQIALRGKYANTHTEGEPKPCVS